MAITKKSIVSNSAPASKPTARALTTAAPSDSLAAGKIVAGKASMGKAVAGKASLGKVVAGKAALGKVVAGKAALGKAMSS